MFGHAAATVSRDWFAVLRKEERGHPDRPRVGCAVRHADDVVRLRHAASLDFAGTAVADIVEKDERAEVGSFHLGLWGPNGALPLHLTEYALERRRIHRDDTFCAFADVFHHRPLCQFYRAWAETEPCAQADREADDAFADYLDAFAGLDEADAMDGRPPDAFLRFTAGRWFPGTRSAEGLESLLSTMFGWAVSVETFVFGYLELATDDRARLGVGQGQLGLSGTCGSRVPTVERLRIHLGPMDFDAYRRLLPDGEAYRLLVGVVRRYLGDTVDWDAQPRLMPGTAPRPTLGSNGSLGWSIWLGGAPTDRDATDLLLSFAMTRTYS